MTQPTVTLPRGVVQQAIEALEYASPFVYKNCVYVGAVKDHDDVIYRLRAALDAPQAVDCRGCMSFMPSRECFRNHPPPGSWLPEPCTDFDKFQALPPISLTKVTK